MRLQKITIILICTFTLIGLALIIGKFLDLIGYEGQLVNRYNNVSQSEIVEIKDNFVIGQTFVAPRNDLQRIDVVLRTFGRNNSKDVTFYLKQGPESSDIIYQETFNASEVKNNQWRTFDFPPITDSAEKTYFFYFTSPTSVIGDAITVGGGEGDYYKDGNVIAGPVPTNADMAFRTYYGLSADEKFSMLGHRLVEDKPSIWHDVRFYILLLILYGLILLRVFVELINYVWYSTQSDS